MASPVDGKPLRYLIALDSAPGEAGAVTLIGYDATAAPQPGIAAGYVNRRQEEGGRKPGVSYLNPPDDIEQEYGEPAPTPGTPYFWKNINDQLDKWHALGVLYIDMDNLDTDNATVALSILDAVVAKGMFVYLKNPNLVDGDKAALVRHAATVAMLCEQDDDLTAGKLDALRVAGGKPSLPIRVVSYGDDGLAWAKKIAKQATDAKLVDFGVTYSAQGEYGSVQHILKPTSGEQPMPVPPPVTSPAPWADTLVADIGRYHDGSDVPALAVRTARRFPDDTRMAQYVTQAGQSTAWCGIYVGDKLSQYGFKPPLIDFGVGGWMYVDAWKHPTWLAQVGATIVPASQKRDGDIALFISSSLHHVTFVHGNKYIGGNQSNTVTEASFSQTPAAVVRMPAPANYVPQPESMPMLMIQSTGDAVRVLQTMLNADLSISLDVDGEFGDATEAAARQYQTKYGLEVDGIVGTETWAKLYAGAPPLVPQPPEEYLLTPEQIAQIMNLAANSAIARYNWKDRGRAPLGYTKGLAVMYAQCARKLEGNDSAVIAMTQPIGSSSKDALAFYTVSATGRANVLRKLFVLLYGLGMRESSGNYTEGRDMSASNVTADTAEAGCFQQSWNSSNSDPEMKKLLPAYGDNKQPCYSNIFKEGITLKQTTSYGTGPGREFQDLAKACPAFATEMCAVGLRVLYNHWGPIVRQEAEMRSEAEALLLQVDAYLKDQPIPPPIEPELPPLSELGKAKKRAMDAIESAVNTLIADVVHIGGGATGVQAAQPQAFAGLAALGEPQALAGMGAAPTSFAAMPDDLLRAAWPHIAQLPADDVIEVKQKMSAGMFNLNDLIGIVLKTTPIGGILTGGGGLGGLPFPIPFPTGGPQPQQPPQNPAPSTGGGGFMTSDSLWANIRYFLIAAGVTLIARWTKGAVDETTATSIVEPIVGAIIALGSVVWGNYVKAGTKAVPVDTAKRADVPTVSPVSGQVQPGNIYR